MLKKPKFWLKLSNFPHVYKVKTETLTFTSAKDWKIPIILTNSNKFWLENQNFDKFGLQKPKCCPK